MKDELIFHLVTQKTWKASQHRGEYIPESLKEEGFIHCSSGQQIEKTANRLFKGEKRLFLLVIDVSRLQSRLTYEDKGGTGEKFPHLYGPINIDAVIDKIKIFPEKDGSFKINVESN